MKLAIIKGARSETWINLLKIIQIKDCHPADKKDGFNSCVQFEGASFGSIVASQTVNSTLTVEQLAQYFNKAMQKE